MGLGATSTRKAPSILNRANRTQGRPMPNDPQSPGSIHPDPFIEKCRLAVRIPGMLGVIATRLDVPEFLISDWLMNRAVPDADQSQQLEPYLNILDGAAGEHALREAGRQAKNYEMALFPPVIDLPVLGMLDFYATRFGLTDDVFKVIPDPELVPAARSRESIRTFQSELRERFGNGFEFDYRPIRISRTDTGATVILGTDPLASDGGEDEARFQAALNQIYWTKLADIPPDRIQWYRVGNDTKDRQSGRIEWGESYRFLRNRSGSDTDIRFSPYVNNWISWKVDSFPSIERLLTPDRWKKRKITFRRKNLVMVVGPEKGFGVKAWSIRSYFSPLRIHHATRGANWGLRMGLSWRIHCHRNADLILPDLLRLIRVLAAWACTGDADCLNALEREVLNPLIDTYA